MGLRKRKTAYELSRSQVDTPTDVVETFWKLTHGYRSRLKSVLDMGAGDGRFAIGGKYQRYVGVEIDKSRNLICGLPKSSQVEYGCAFKHEGFEYSACIGNPPYVRHHDLDPKWRDRIAHTIEESLNISVNRKCNLYVYFLFLALMKSRSNGLISLIVPYEWVSRPASKPLREYIESHKWNVNTYRFDAPIFSGVETTASITVIDKREKNGEWTFHSLKRDGTSKQIPKVTGTRNRVIDYSDRGEIWSMRGMSPGTQKVFTLTEGERIHNGLSLEDVYPCVTSLKVIPSDLAALTRLSFQSRFVETGEKCWLIRSNKEELSPRLAAYLKSIPENMRATSTCLEREKWYKYSLFDKPDLLVSSGFVGKSPKTLINSIGAYCVGGVHGVYNVPTGTLRSLQRYLSTKDCSSQVVAHSGKLKKIEVRQLNALLIEFKKRLINKNG